jgi:hypothetical protein
LLEAQEEDGMGWLTFFKVVSLLSEWDVWSSRSSATLFGKNVETATTAGKQWPGRLSLVVKLKLWEIIWGIYGITTTTTTNNNNITRLSAASKQPKILCIMPPQSILCAVHSEYAFGHSGGLPSSH